ncbi:MAG: hypothetical protein ACJAYE_000457 [Candidatus Azotimanducaceae bacterium]|jgi:hypothetical protein
MSRISIILIISLLTIGHASAADLRTELAKCRSIASLALRLQCYDRVVDGVPAANTTSVAEQTAPVLSSPAPVSASASAATTPSTVVSQKSALPVAAAEAIDQVEPEELFGKSAEEIKQAVSEKLEIASIDEISSKVARVQINSSQEYVVYLENGQVWKQKDKAGKWRIKVGETAIISTALLGSFKMKSDARKKSVRAERLR